MNESAQINKTFGNVSSAILDSAAVVTAALGFSGALGEGVTGQALGHAAAGRIGGIGGHLMLATMNQKKDSAKAREENEASFSLSKVEEAVNIGLGDNPINRSAAKSVKTVFEILHTIKNKDDEEDGDSK